jgi:hypothetical protein
MTIYYTTSIRQGSLFDLQKLYELEPPHRFEEIFSTIDSRQVRRGRFFFYFLNRNVGRTRTVLF